MSKHILKCTKCEEYSLDKTCSKCGSTCVEVKPPKYSPEDKYEEHRRKAKKEELVKKGLV
tara:strand:+ start:1721 stop:1900 length:180 start_codon:yes stop_codon:yes gene_type:complete